MRSLLVNCAGDKLLARCGGDKLLFLGANLDPCFCENTPDDLILDCTFSVINTTENTCTDGSTCESDFGTPCVDGGGYPSSVSLTGTISRYYDNQNPPQPAPPTNWQNCDSEWRNLWRLNLYVPDRAPYTQLDAIASIRTGLDANGCFVTRIVNVMADVYGYPYFPCGFAPGTWVFFGDGESTLVKEGCPIGEYDGTLEWYLTNTSSCVGGSKTCSYFISMSDIVISAAP